VTIPAPGQNPDLSKNEPTPRLLRLHPFAAAGIYLLLDVICVGMGMGVPLFCILLGFPSGLYFMRRALLTAPCMRAALRSVFVLSVASALVTFVMMAVIWGLAQVPMLLDPAADLAHFGIPLILYSPRASFIGWFALMVLLSPFLQLLMAVFGSYVILLAHARD
jgi:hypothetical protein